MPRRIVAIAAGVAGIYLLAGLGWALLSLAVLVEVAWPRERAGGPAWMEPWQRNVLKAWRQVQALPQQMTGVTAVVVGVALVPTGAGLVLGMWGALLVLGALLLSLGLVLDRTA